MPILSPNSIVGKYRVVSFIKDGEYNETYRVEDIESPSNRPYFMKLYLPEKVPSKVKTPDGTISEIALARDINHELVVSYITDGIHKGPDSAEYPYIIYNYFSGRLISEMLGYGKTPFSLEDVIHIFRSMLQGLAALHTSGLVHNDITPRNVMYNPDSREVMIIDLGHIARALSHDHRYITTDLEPLYRSPESFKDANDPAGDIFAAAAVAYATITGHAPWNIDLTAFDDDSSERDRSIKMAIHRARKKPLSFDDAAIDVPEWMQDTLRGALDIRPGARLGLDKILNALDSQSSPIDRSATQGPSDQKDGPHGEASAPQSPAGTNPTAPKQKQPDDKFAVKKGNGFDDVAGMDELKDLLRKKVLFILKNRDKAERYRLTPPSGMLLYGPPGCGKTYFAEKFAEESGFNFKFVKASDIGSIYVHGGQGKIAELFDAARKQAPVILCFDEFDAMVPERSSRGAEHIAGEVNEFLTQLNNCGKDGVFVIGTTNQPELIDKAILRKGRLDISVYIPEPNVETRRLMFDLHLKNRPCESIDTARLAELTNNYVSSDIAFIVNDAAMIAAFRDEPISQAQLEESIKSTRPSLSENILKNYEESRRRIENLPSAGNRPRVGFMQYE